MTATWRFSALDTLFFRDSRPHGSAGAAVLGSLFPPSARTVAGAIRFLIGNALGANWATFGKAPLGEPMLAGGVDLLALIGRHDDYGSLRFTGPWLSVGSESGWQRLYPAPRTLVADSAGRLLSRLEIGPAIECDLGQVHLPCMPRGLQSADGIWLDRHAYAQAWSGDPPTTGVHRASDLFTEEPRLGIARAPDQHTAAPGLLYQTLHIRPREGAPHGPSGKRPERLAIEVGLTAGEGVPETLARLARLGGEGRLVDVHVEAGDSGIPEPPALSEACVGLILTLLTPADLDGGWLPPGFEAIRNGSTTVWRGTLQGTDLTLHSAVIGKVIREGGWDLAARKPRAVRSLVPAGSAWYATIADRHGRRLRGLELAAAIDDLHGAYLQPNALGRGQLAVGTFDTNAFPYLEVS